MAGLKLVAIFFSFVMCHPFQWEKREKTKVGTDKKRTKAKKLGKIAGMGIKRTKHILR